MSGIKELSFCRNNEEIRSNEFKWSMAKAKAIALIKMGAVKLNSREIIRQRKQQRVNEEQQIFPQGGV